MTIATWNVNSIRARFERLVAWLKAPARRCAGSSNHRQDRRGKRPSDHALVVAELETAF